MSLLVDELREKILQDYDVDLLCEALQITAEEILDAFETKLLENLEIFEELVDNQIEGREEKEEQPYEQTD